jgi:hypothetical protein
MRSLAIACCVALAAGTVLAQESDPFRTAPPPPPATQKRLAPEPPAPAYVPPQPPPTPAEEYYRGQGSIWMVRAILVGKAIKGEIQCYRRGLWSGWGPTFEATLDSGGAFDVPTSHLDPWAPRRISGVFPNIKIEATSSQHLDCPNGDVILEKTPDWGR